MIHDNNFSNGALNPALSYLVSCVGCFLGLRCTTRARAYQGAARARWLTLAALSIGTTGIWVMHFIAMLGFTIAGQPIRYNVPVTILSMVIAVLVVGIGTFIVGFSRAGTWPLLLGGMIIAVIAGTAALWAALRLDTVWSTFVASLIMGVAVNGMHYTSMAAVRAHPAPGLVVSTSATASATAFLLPLILGLSSIGFIFSAVIALSPTAADIFEEDELMKRIKQSQAARYEPLTRQAPAGPQDPARPDQAQPGSLFRPYRPKDQP